MLDIISKRYGTWEQFISNTLHGSDGDEIVFKKALGKVVDTLELNHEERYNLAVSRLALSVTPQVEEELKSLFEYEKLKDSIFLITDGSYFLANLYVSHDRIILFTDYKGDHDEDSEEYRAIVELEHLKENKATTLEKVLKVQKIFGRVPILVAKELDPDWCVWDDYKDD